MEPILKNLIYPKPVIIIGFIVMLSLDLLTGILKASKKQKTTTSNGLRRTVDKASTYCILILSLLVILNLTILSNSTYNYLFDYSINGVIMFCIWIEFKSVLENLIVINTSSDGTQNFLCEHLLTRLHDLVIFKFKR